MTGGRQNGAPVQQPGPLTGLTAIDCGQVVAGPTVGMILADLGMDVIKVEHPSGDPLRWFGPRKGDVPLHWKFLGRNKRSITLDLSKPEGQDLLLRVVDQTRADILIESFRPGTLERWNLGYERLRSANPGLVMIRVSGFGQDGPYRDRPGFGTLAEAMSGFANIVGAADGPPTLPPFPLADTVAALYGVIAAVASLYVRDAGGRRTGQVADISLLEPLFSMLGQYLVEYDQLGTVARRAGNRSSSTAPRNVYPTKDGAWIAIAASTQSTAVRLFGLMGRPELNEDPRFRTNVDRLHNVVQLDPIVEEWTRTRTRDELLAALVAAGVPAAPVSSVEDLTVDEHLLARGAIAVAGDPELGNVRLPSPLPRLSDTPAAIRRPAPGLGEHNQELYIDLLGMTPEELDGLRRRGVV